MKIDTISTYILLYLLTCVRFNVFVPVKADGQTASSGQGGGSPVYSRTARVIKDCVDLNIKSDNSSNRKFEYKKVGQYVTYTAKDNYAFKVVKEGNTELWKASDDTNYSGRVEVDLMNNDSKSVTIYFADNKTKVFKKDGTNKLWKEIDTSKFNLETFNIDYPYETYFYKNQLANNIRTFTAKTGFAFNGANEYINDRKIEIWKTDNESEYANKFEVDLMDKDSKAVTIYFADNKTKLFMKYNKDESWTEIDLTKVKPKSIDITDDNDTYFYSSMVQDSSRTFETKNGFAINCVKDGNNNVWTTTNESEYANKVVSAKRHSGVLDVTIYMGNGNMKLFIKETEHDPWKQIDLTKVNPSSVHIDYKHDSYICTNELNNNVRTFTAKTGFTFKGAHEYVNDKKVEIWKTENESEYVNQIVMYPVNVGGKAVRIYLADNKTKLFMKSGKNESWTEIDTTEVNPKSVSIQDRDDTYFYSNRLNNDVRTFEARDGFSFNAVKDGNNNVWTTANENEYAKKIVSAKRSYGKLDITIHLGNGKRKLFVMESDSEGWKEIDLTIINPRSMNIRYDKETYFYSNKLQGSTRTFEARDGFAFNVVNEYIGNKRVEIWKTTIDKEYSKKVVAEGEDMVAIYMADATIKAFKKRSDGNWSAYTHDSTTQTKKASEPQSSSSTAKTAKTVIDLNITSDTESTDNFDYNKDSTYVTYTAKDNYAFKVVKEGNTELWKASDDTNYSGRVEVDLMNNDSKSVTIYFADNKTKVYMKSGKNGLWTEIDTSKVNSKSVNIKYEHESYFYTNKLDNNVRTFQARHGFAFNGFRDGDNNVWTTTNETEYANKVVSAKRHSGILDVTINLVNGGKKLFIKENDSEGWKEIDLSEVNPETVNIDYPYESYFYTNTLVDGVRTFEAKKGFAFNGANEYVNRNKVEIWKTDNESEYANKLVSAKSHSGVLDLTIHLSNGKKKLFVMESETEGWKEIDLSEVNPETVNIDYPYESYFYTNTLVDGVRTFEAKKGFAFNGANEYVNRNKVEIWKTDNESEYANKLVSAKSHSGVLDLTIHLVNGGKKLFIKENDSEGWKEIDITKVNPKSVNIHYQYDSYFYTNRLDNNVRTFEARHGFAFNGFRDGDNNVWTTTNESEYAKKIEVDLMNYDSKAVTFYFTDNKTKLFMKSGKNESWTEIDTSKINRKSINIDYPNNSYFYTNTLVDGVRTFESKTGFGFECANKYVNNNKIELWKADDPNEYANKVVSAKRSYGKLDLTIHLSNGKKKLFVMESETEGWKEIDLSQVNARSMNIRYDKETYFYSNKLQGSTRTFEARDGFAFNVVNEYIGNKRVEIWKTTIDKEYSKKVVAKGDNKVTIYIGGGGIIKAFNKGIYGNWIEDRVGYTTPESDDSTEPAEGAAQPAEVTPTPPADPSGASTQPKVKLLKVNPSDTENPLELDPNEFTYTQSGNVAIYHINVDCVQLIFDGVLLWLYDSAKHGGIYPKSVYHDTTTDVLLLRFEGLDITFENTNEGWVFTESGPLAVKLYVIDPNDPNNSVELDSNQLTVTESGDITTFNIANGVNSIALTYGPILLWQHDASKLIDKYPNSLYYSETTETLVLRFEGLDITFAKNDQGDWEYTETDTSAGGAATTTPPENQSGSSTQPKVKLLKVNPSDTENPLELDANEYTYTQSGNVASYQIADGANCFQLIFDGVLLWLYDPSYHGGIHPKIVYHDTTTDVLLLRFDGLDITFQNTNEGWIFSESGQLAVKFHLPDPSDATKTVELSINQFTSTTNGDVTTFNIADNVNSTALTYGPVLLWQHDPNQRGGKYPKSLDYTTSSETLVLRFEGLDITFAKNTGGQWEYTETATSDGGAATTPEDYSAQPEDQSGAFTQPKVKLFKVNPSDTENPLELDANEFTYTQSGNVAIYHINVDCVQLIFDGVLLWLYDSAKHGGIYPKIVYHDTTTDALVLRFEGLDITFQNTNEGWIFSESGQLAVKFHLPDPSDATKTVELSINQFTSTTNGDVTTFNIADNVNSTALTYGPVLLWQHDPNQRGGKYPKSLDYTTSSETLVLRFEGLDITFAKNTGGQWEYTETATSDGGAATTPEDYSAQPEDQSGAFTQPKVKLLKVNPSDEANPLELDANEFTYTQSGDIVSYLIADDINCIHLTFDDVLLWVYDSTKHGGIYPKSVYHDTTTDILLLRFDGLDITFAKNDQGQWVFTESHTSGT